MRRRVTGFFRVGKRFQSTHSLRSATRYAGTILRKSKVSIHALLAECDALPCELENAGCCFNPRTPCGVRHTSPNIPPPDMTFQSTHSLRSATHNEGDSTTLEDVSIHALLAECDNMAKPFCPVKRGFNPRTPCGVRHDSDDMATFLREVSIHALLAECDGSGILSLVLFAVSIHALLAECDALVADYNWQGQRFNPRTPCGVRPSLTRIRGIKLWFQSTHSLRSATIRKTKTMIISMFQSTHSLRSATQSGHRR